MREKEGERSTHRVLLVLVTTFFKAVVLGPMGAAAAVVWDRDEEAMSGERGREREGDVVEAKKEQ